MTATMTADECIVLFAMEIGAVSPVTQERIFRWIESLTSGFDVPLYAVQLGEANAGDIETLLARCSKETRRTRLLVGGSHLETAITFVSLEALLQGCDVYLLADVITVSAPRYELLHWQRLCQAGVVPTTLSQIIEEWGVSSVDDETTRKLRQLAKEFRELIS